MNSQISAISEAVHDVLGVNRVRRLETRRMINSDGAVILLVRVVYDASLGITVPEIDRITEEAWTISSDESAAAPVFDFQEDTDFEPVAAE